MGVSVHPDWISELRLQQQSVLVLALRGPDGDPKHTPFKVLLRAFRGTVLKAAKYGRMLYMGERADNFMSLDVIGDEEAWRRAIAVYLDDYADGAVLHHYTHFMHAAQILAYKHPDAVFRQRWLLCYVAFVDRLHLMPETESQMDARLSDWKRRQWDTFGVER